MRRLLPAALAVAAVTMSCDLGTAGDRGSEDADWSRWRGPNGDGISMESDWNPAAVKIDSRTLWEVNVGFGYSNVTIEGQRLYTMGNRELREDTVYCLDKETGEEIWRYSYPCRGEPRGAPGTNATPVVDGGYVYTLSRWGHLFCFDAGTGEIIWRRNITEELGAKPPGWGHAGSALIEDDMLLLNAASHGMALDKRTGKTIWASPAGVSGHATPILFNMRGERCVAIFGCRALHAVLVKTGELLWSYPWENGLECNAADPVILGDTILISSSHGAGSALIDIKSGKPEVVWQNKIMNNYTSGFVLVDDYLYGFDERRKLMCIDWKTGQDKWRSKLGLGGLIAADGKLIILNESGELIIAKATPSSYQEIAKRKVFPGKVRCWTAPVLCKGRILCRSNRGDLVCIDVST